MNPPEDLMKALSERIAEIGAAESIDTERAFIVAYKLGDDMRNGYTQRKQQTLAHMLGTSATLQESNDPAAAACGLIIQGFIAGWIGIEKLNK